MSDSPFTPPTCKWDTEGVICSRPASWKVACMRNKNDEPLLCCDECKRQIVMDYGVKAEPLTMLCGFPVVFTDKVPSLGTAGPIILGSLPDTPPSEFWVIEYAGLVFDRTLLAFVPMGFLRKAVPLDAMKRVMYEDVEEARAQKNELAALGVVVEVSYYSREQ